MTHCTTHNTLTIHLPPPLQILKKKVPDRIVRQIKRALVPSTGTSVSYVTSVVVLRLLPLYLTSSLEHVLTKTLTRALTHSIGSTLTHTLSSENKRRRRHGGGTPVEEIRKEKIEERNNAEREYYMNHDAAYYSDYYSDFYTGNPNPRPSSEGEYLYAADPKETISLANKKKFESGSVEN